MKILGLCASLRENSSNRALLKAVRAFWSAHEWSEFSLFDLPFFDPDKQFSDETPQKVLALRELAASSDLIFISTPEYAHGLPGVLKNALEWLFHEGTQRKPVRVVIGSAQGEFARDQLLEILKTMDFTIAPEDFLLIKGARAKINSDGIFTDKKEESCLKDFLLGRELESHDRNQQQG